MDNTPILILFQKSLECLTFCKYYLILYMFLLEHFSAQVLRSSLLRHRRVGSYKWSCSDPTLILLWSCSDPALLEQWISGGKDSCSSGWEILQRVDVPVPQVYGYWRSSCRCFVTIYSDLTTREAGVWYPRPCGLPCSAVPVPGLWVTRRSCVCTSITPTSTMFLATTSSWLWQVLGKICNITS